MAHFEPFYLAQINRNHWHKSNRNNHFFGNQLSAHVGMEQGELDYCGQVDGAKVPIPHFGCLLSVDQFTEIKQRLVENGVEFIIKPQVRYPGEKGEQHTMFVLDYSGNPLEFKAFNNPEEVFV